MALTEQERDKKRKEATSRVRLIEFGGRSFVKGKNFHTCKISPMDENNPFWIFEFESHNGSIETYCTTMPVVIIQDGPFTKELEDEE